MLDIQINDCEQMSLDYNWSLTRKNACHIANQNDEMGAISKDVASLRTEMKAGFNNINLQMNTISIYQGLNIGIWTIIGIAIVGLVIKKFWGKAK